MMVDFRESEVLERTLAQILKQPGLCGLRCNDSRGDMVQQGAKLRAGHDVKGGLAVDLSASRAVYLSFVCRDGFIAL
jgi:hypothetical protein